MLRSFLWPSCVLSWWMLHVSLRRMWKKILKYHDKRRILGQMCEQMSVYYCGKWYENINLKKWVRVIQMSRKSVKRTSIHSNIILILELKDSMVCLGPKTTNNENSFYSLQTCVSGIVLNILHALSHLTITKLWGRYCSDKKTPEALSDQMICPRMQN